MLTNWIMIIFTLLPLWMTSNEMDTVDGNRNYELSCDSENWAFQPGEELVYKIYYNLDFIWIPAGEVSFHVYDGGTAYKLEAYGKTYPSYEWFYKVDDVYKTSVDKSTLLPMEAMRELREGGYRVYEEVTFDQSNQSAAVFRGKKKDEAVDRGEYAFENCANDILALLYKLRNIDKSAFQDAGSIPISFFLDMKTYNIDLSYLKSETKKVRGLGKFETLKISPSLVAGDVFNEGDRMIAWVSNDNNTIPLLMESPLTVGSVKVVLKSHKGLRYPLREL